MKNVLISFEFNDEDYEEYTVQIGEQNFIVNYENNSINIQADKQISVNILYSPKKITFLQIVAEFFLELLKIPFMLFFELTPENKWYKGSHVHKFDYKLLIDVSNLESLEIQIKNPMLSTNKSFAEPDVVVDNDSIIISKNQYSKYCFEDLKNHLLKHIFLIFWLTIILTAFVSLCFHNNILIMLISISLIILLGVILSILSIQKYNRIKNQNK